MVIHILVCLFENSVDVSDRVKHVANVDEIKLVFLVYPLLFDVVDEEMDVFWYIVWLDRGQVETGYLGERIFVADCREERNKVSTKDHGPARALGGVAVSWTEPFPGHPEAKTTTSFWC